MWAKDVVVSVTGLSREQRDILQSLIEAGGGRYCRSLSRDCTHLVVALESCPSTSKKLALALRNRDKWQTHIVSPAWAPACAAARVRLLEVAFSVPRPRTPQPRARTPAAVTMVRQQRLSRFAPSSMPHEQAHRGLPPQKGLNLAAEGKPASLKASATAASHQLMESARNLFTHSRRQTGSSGVGSKTDDAATGQTAAKLTTSTGPLSALPPFNSRASPDSLAKAVRSIGLSSILRGRLQIRASPAISIRQARSERVSIQVAPGVEPSAAAFVGTAAHGEAPQDAMLPSVPSARNLSQQLLALRLAKASAEMKGMPRGAKGPGQPPEGHDEGSRAAAEGAQGSQLQGTAANAQADSCARGACFKDGKASSLRHEGEPSSQLQDVVCKGVAAMLDPALAVPEADRVRAMLEDGGEHCESRGALLGGHVSHIVRLPEAAPSWCGLGANIVSPQSVVQSAKLGSQERCLRLSADALEYMHPFDMHAALVQGQSSGSTHAEEPAMHSSKQEPLRQDQHGPEHRRHPGSFAAALPATLLEGIIWNVGDLPDSACMEQSHSKCSSTPTDDDPSLDDRAAQPLSAGDCDHRVFSGARLTMAFPLGGEHQRALRRLHVGSAGASTRQLLCFIHCFYQEELSVEEVTALCQGDLIRRGEQLRAALLAGRAARRIDLLRGQTGFQGLKRASHAIVDPVYVLQLA